MTLRFKLFILPTLAITAAAGLIAWQSEQYARRQFAEIDRERSEALVAQFNREVAQRGEEVVRAVQSVADSEATLRMAMELSQPKADPSMYANDARGIANTYHLDFLEIVTADGSLISSAQWPAASGYHNDWVAGESDWNHQGAFLGRVPLPDNNIQLGLLAVRAVRVGENNLYIIGGWRFDREFLSRLAVPDGMRTLLYSNLEPTFAPAALAGPDGPAAQPEQFESMIESLRSGQHSQPQLVQASDPGANAETFIGAPLSGRGKDLLGILLVGSSQRDVLALVNYIRYLALLAAGGGVLFGVALSWWISARVSRPVARLADAVREVQSGKDAPGALSARPRHEAAQPAGAFNEMAGNPAREREQLLQKERVTARREMARRFTREIKESLFPLHMSAEDLIHAREETSERFDEIFFESMASLRAELARLRGVAMRFGQFATMPPPKAAPASVNEAVRGAVSAVEPHFRAEGRPPVTPEVHLAEGDPIVHVDPDLLRVGLENLLLDCTDAMSAGGILTIQTRAKDGIVRIEMDAKGASFPPQECSRLFTPGGSKVEGMLGLGLATAHAVVSDLGGRIFAEPSPDGATFRLEFAAAPVGARPSTTPSGAAKQPRQLTAGLAQLPASVVAAPPAEPAPATVAAVESAAISEEVPAIAAAAPSSSAGPSDSLRAHRGLTFTA